MNDERVNETAQSADETTTSDAAEETAETITEDIAAESDEATGEPAKKDKKSKKDDKKNAAEMKKSLEDAKARLSEYEDKYLRLVAEYDNFRKRSAKELETRYSDAYADAVTLLLPIIDNIERASQFKEDDKIAEGISLIVKSFPENLAKLGIEVFGDEGDVFDPNFHNAVMKVDSEDRKEGEIVSVFQKGYKRGDKIIRYAMVTVAN
jgi:Molecular chaperone GrpE (heat shock protein)